MPPLSIHTRKPWAAARSGKGGRLVRQDRLCALRLAFLIEIGLDDPLMQPERRARGIDDLAAIDDAEIGVHLQPQALKRRRQMPGIDQLTINGRLTTDSFKARSVENGLPKRVTGQGLVKTGDRGRGFGQRMNHAGPITADRHQPRKRVAASH